MPVWRRKLYKTLLTLVPTLIFVRYIYHTYNRQQSQVVLAPRDGRRILTCDQHLSHLLDSLWGDFESVPISGFINSGQYIDETCQSMHAKGTIAVQKSRHLHDNLIQIAAAVDNHELVVDEYRSKLGKSKDEQRRTRESWARLSGSAVWLPEQQVYLLVTRVMFYARYNIE